MIGYLFLSIGGLLFAILLLCVYFIKARQTTINNKMFKLLLLLSIFIIVSELVTISFLYSYPAKVELGKVLCKVNGVMSLTWIMSLALYVSTIGKAYKIKTYREYFKDIRAKIIVVLYIIFLILLLLSSYSPIITDKYAYINGRGEYVQYVAAVAVIILLIIVIIRNKKELPEVQRGPIIVGICETIISMILQIIFPMIPMLTESFVFKTYLLYFMFENPDLYLIKELEIAKKRSDDSNRSKTDFLSNMSHEIRTPINAIMGFSEGIVKENITNIDEAREDIAHIYSAGNNLLEIINNILDISKIETGEEKLELKEYNIANMISELKSIIETRLANKKINFITNIDPNIPSKMLGDRTKIFQVLLNILSNSVKYTEVGRITLTITSEIVNANAILHIKISDTGYGIKKEDYEKLFEKFSRLENATKKEIEGTGLGLLITKRLVTLMDGKIWFESEYGAGTTFFVELSQKIMDKNPIGNLDFEEKTSIKHEYLDCSGYKILLVDDNKLNLLVAEKVLSPYKFNIEKLTSGEECVNKIKGGATYDLIFLDHMMPKMDGIEVLHILKKLEDYSIPPIVVLTANAIAGMKEIYLKEGFDDYLSKPINISELDRIIKKYFKNKKDFNKTYSQVPAEDTKKQEPVELFDNNFEKEDSIINQEKENTFEEKSEEKEELSLEQENEVEEKQSTENENKLNKKYLESNGFNIEESMNYLKDIATFNDVLRFFYDGLDEQLNELSSAKDDMTKYAILVHGLKSDCRSLGIEDFTNSCYNQELKSKENDSQYINEHFNDLVEYAKKYKIIIKNYLGL